MADMNPSSAATDQSHSPFDIRRWSRKKQLGAAFLGVCLLLLASWIFVDQRIHAAFIQRCADYRARGIPILVGDTVQAPLPDAENRLYFVRLAIRSMPQGKERMEQVGDAVEDYGYGEFAADPALRSSLPAVLQYMDEAQARDQVYWRIDPTVLMNLDGFPEVGKTHQLAMLLGYEALSHAAEGDASSALNRMEQIFVLSEVVAPLPNTVAQLVGSGMEGYACAALLAMMRDIDLRDDSDRMRAKALMDRLTDMTRHRAYVARLLQYDRMQLLHVLLDTASRRPVRFMVQKEAMRAMDDYDTVISAANEPTLAQARAKMPPLSPQPSIMNYPKLFTALWEGSRKTLVESQFRQLTEKRVAAVALAIALYRSDHQGAWPATLDELVPAYLSALPSDPLATTEQPIGYSQERRLLYSVGMDGIDGDGDETPIKKTYRTNLGAWEFRDAVFPLAARARPEPLEEETD